MRMIVSTLWMPASRFIAIMGLATNRKHVRATIGTNASSTRESPAGAGYLLPAGLSGQYSVKSPLSVNESAMPLV
jgi:hypothetical protein